MAALRLFPHFLIFKTLGCDKLRIGNNNSVCPGDGRNLVVRKDAGLVSFAHKARIDFFIINIEIPGTAIAAQNKKKFIHPIYDTKYPDDDPNNLVGSIIRLLKRAY